MGRCRGFTPCNMRAFQSFCLSSGQPAAAHPGMASAVASPAQQQQLQQKSMQEGSASELALVPIDSVSEEDPIDLTMPVSRLPVELEIADPVREFSVRNLVGLDRGPVIGTKWEQSDDLPPSAGEVQLAWTEFAVVDAQLASRVTRLA